jgi:hypothetical protein
METKLKALQDFIKEYEVNVNYFYSIHVMSNKIVLQGYDNKYPHNLGANFTEPTASNTDFIEYNFEFQSQPFNIILT